MTFDRLPTFDDTVKNRESLVHQIDLATARCCPFMRTAGSALPGQRQIPLEQEVMMHLRDLVNQAMLAFWGQTPGPDDRDIEGFASDDVFDVQLRLTNEPNVFELAISMRLV